jgi:hypothetical protein
MQIIASNCEGLCLMMVVVVVVVVVQVLLYQQWLNAKHVRQAIHSGASNQ